MSAGGLLKQEPLNPGRPNAYSDTGLIIRCNIDFEYDDRTGQLGFFYRARVSKPGKPTDLTDILNIDVHADVVIEIRLSRDKIWYWSSTLDAITTKKKYDQFYGELLYEDENGVFRPSGPIKKCRAIRFVAAKNDIDVNDDSHGFSMNIDLMQPDGKLLPITLDPDIKNPPPDAPLHGGEGSGKGSKYLSAG